MNHATLHKHAKQLYQAAERLLIAIERDMESETQPQGVTVDETATPTVALEEPKRVDAPVVVKPAKKP